MKACKPVVVRAELPGVIEDVFSFVSNPKNDPKWVDTTPEVKQTKGRKPKVGATYTFQQTVGRTVTGNIEILEMDVPNSMAFRVEDPMRIYTIYYEFESVRDGTRLAQTSVPTFKIELGWKRRVIRLFIRKQLRKQMKALAKALVS